MLAVNSRHIIVYLQLRAARWRGVNWCVLVGVGVGIPSVTNHSR